MREPPEYEPRDDVERWRRRNERAMTLLRGLVVGLIIVAVGWFIYANMR